MDGSIIAFETMPRKFTSIASSLRERLNAFREISRFVSTMIKNRREGRFRVFSLDEGKERTCSKARTCLYLSFGGYNSTWWSGKCDEKKYYFYKSHPLSFPRGERNHSGIEYHLHFCPFIRNYIQRIRPPLRFMECKLSTILFPLGWALVTRAGLFHKLMENR